jgi:hypothetical protein
MPIIRKPFSINKKISTPRNKISFTRDANALGVNRKRALFLFTGSTNALDVNRKLGKTNIIF